MGLHPDTLYYIKAVLVCLGGIFWVITYLRCIYLGARLKSYCIPFVALFLNIGWEFYNTIRGFMIAGMYFLNFVNALWLILDIFIVVTFWRYGRKSSQKKGSLIALVIFLFLAGLVINHWFAQTFTPKIGANYMGFAINILMSILFVTNLHYNKLNFTHDMGIAVFKLMGTLSLTLLLGVFGVTRLGGVDRAMLWLGMIVFCIDSWYVVKLIMQGYRFRGSVNT